MTPEEIYEAAGLTEEDIARMPAYAEDEEEFYGSEAFGKLYDYFMHTGEMPYGVAKARTEMPDAWILEQLGF